MKLFAYLVCKVKGIGRGGTFTGSELPVFMVCSVTGVFPNVLLKLLLCFL